MMRCMVYFRKRTTLALVYETLITLLMENAGVDLRGTKSRDLYSHELLNDTSLNKMGYVYSARTNSWDMKQKRRKGGQDEKGEGFEKEENPEDIEEGGPSELASYEVPQNITTRRGIQLILEKLARMERKLDEHIQECRMLAPSRPQAGMGDPSTGGPSSSQQPTDSFSHPEA
ncbi:hypothetical protein SLA2020_233980 [Shorea laevis]